MKTDYVLQRSDGMYLADDFESWVPDVKKAHRFIPGAALNSCIEANRRDGARVVTVDVE